MEIFSMVLSLLSGVALFLFGMSLMGDGLKQVAGNKLEAFLYKMTNTPLKGVALGTGVTSVIQSSSATTVMVIGFVNSGMMKLKQAIGIIMGANIGTSITGWILCLSYIEGSNGIAKILSSATIAAVVAVIGTIMRMICKRTTHKNIGNIMLCFAILMYPGRCCIYGCPAERICYRWCIAGFIGNRNPYIFQCISDYSWYRCRSILSGTGLSDRSK